MLLKRTSKYLKRCSLLKGRGQCFSDTAVLSIVRDALVAMASSGLTASVLALMKTWVENAGMAWKMKMKSATSKWKRLQ